MAERYYIHEGNLERLTKKITAIRNKCAKYNLDFHFEVVGEEFKSYEDKDGDEVTVKYYIVEAEGEVHHADWEFIGVIDYHDDGNVIRQYRTDIEVPARFRHSDRTCEHCNKLRSRKETYIIHNTASDDWKQVGTGCLCEFTNGFSADAVAAYMSCFEEVIKGEAIYGGSSSYERYQERDLVLRYAYETVKHFGYEKADEWGSRYPTRARVYDYICVGTGATRYMTQSFIDKCKEEMAYVNFNVDTDEVKQFVSDAVTWAANNSEDSNQYLYNLKVVCSSEWIKDKDFGILVSLIPTYMRQIEREIEKSERAKAHEAEMTSEYVGTEGERITEAIKSATCVYSGENMYGITFMYKFVTNDNNILMWSTDKSLDTDTIDSITGTVKKYEEFNHVKQTWLTRCKVTNNKSVAKAAPAKGTFDADEILRVFDQEA